MEKSIISQAVYTLTTYRQTHCTNGFKAVAGGGSGRGDAKEKVGSPVVWGCVSSCGKEGRNQMALICALGPSVTPICLNSNGVNPIHGLFVLSAVRVKQMGVAGGPDVPIRVAWLRPFFPHD
ncbi:hypothetical protein Y032_0043g863 [Ancylostoma ceylanicum]|uniref:Uncharacterized protein n=1 Tax=Ancylostoma ceylanicum TaxID=53326 RepID=A0A016UGF4_9BILA|nr:hypothetical protein Y032_0043g863 [Ancylostoma ceylanicum]